MRLGKIISLQYKGQVGKLTSVNPPEPNENDIPGPSIDPSQLKNLTVTQFLDMQRRLAQMDSVVEENKRLAADNHQMKKIQTAQKAKIEQLKEQVGASNTFGSTHFLAMSPKQLYNYRFLPTANHQNALLTAGDTVLHVMAKTRNPGIEAVLAKLRTNRIDLLKRAPQNLGEILAVTENNRKILPVQYAVMNDFLLGFRALVNEMRPASTTHQRPAHSSQMGRRQGQPMANQSSPLVTYLNSWNQSGQTPLHTAVTHNALAIVTDIVDQISAETSAHTAGQQPSAPAPHEPDAPSLASALNLQEQFGNRLKPFHLACQLEGDHAVEMVKKLRPFYDINDATNGWGATGLYLACQTGNQAIVSYLLNEGADRLISTSGFNFSPLYIAVKWGHPQVVKQLLSKQAAEQLQAPAKSSAEGFDCHIIHVCLFEYQETNHLILKELLAHGADLGETDANGNTPLHLAIKYGDLQSASLIMEELAKAGRHDLLNVTNNENETPIDQLKALLRDNESSRFQPTKEAYRGILNRFNAGQVFALLNDHYVSQLQNKIDLAVDAYLQGHMDQIPREKNELETDTAFYERVDNVVNELLIGGADIVCKWVCDLYKHKIISSYLVRESFKTLLFSFSGRLSAYFSNPDLMMNKVKAHVFQKLAETYEGMYGTSKDTPANTAESKISDAQNYQIHLSKIFHLTSAAPRDAKDCLDKCLELERDTKLDFEVAFSTAKEDAINDVLQLFIKLHEEPVYAHDHRDPPVRRMREKRQNLLSIIDQASERSINLNNTPITNQLVFKYLLFDLEKLIANPNGYLDAANPKKDIDLALKAIATYEKHMDVVPDSSIAKKLNTAKETLEAIKKKRQQDISENS